MGANKIEKKKFKNWRVPGFFSPPPTTHSERPKKKGGKYQTKDEIKFFCCLLKLK
jgi:hypothetical protein